MAKSSQFLYGAVCGASLSVVALLCGPAVSQDTRVAVTRLKLFGEVFDRVRATYVEAPDEGKMVEGALQGMLSSLDPHSQWLGPKEWADMQVTTSGEFGGLGIEIVMDQGVVKVVSPIDDTPAARAGVLPGDFIVKINDEEVRGMSQNDAIGRMRGTPGTSVRITVVRKDAKEPLELTLTREPIKVRSVKAKADGDVGVIRISQFNANAGEGVAKAISELSAQIGDDKIKGFVLDLRNNPGGLLDQAVKVSSAFMPSGEVVSVRGRDPSQNQHYSASGGDLARGKPVVVLVNGGSASASEIVAGALQDTKRAVIMGTRSFGKGSVQTIVPMADGAMRLTIARYYTPAGRSIQAKGIVPDKVVRQAVPDELKGKDEIRGESSLPGHLANGEEDTSASSAYVPAEADKDLQLKAAVAEIRGEVPTTP